MMKAAYLPILCATLLIETGVAQYFWTCSQEDEHGKRYIPSVRDYESNVLTATSASGVINLYRVQNLNAECYGEVTAIEFCYQYNTIGLGEAVFNWTVLILEETAVFTIARIITIESHPDLLSGADCMDTGIAQAECCDREYISGFNLQMNNFIFGVTESAQGNTRGATLLGFFPSQPEYRVDTLLIPSAGQTISVSSTLYKPEGVQLGLRMLWFVIGDQEIDLISTTNHHTTSSLNQATTKFTDQGIQDRSTTSSLSTDNNHEGIATVASTLQEISSIIPYAVGGAVGGFVVIIVITLVIIVVPLLVRKRREKSHKVEPNNNIGLLAYDNAMYDVAGGTFKQASTCLDINIPADESERFSTAVYNSITEQTKVETLPQDYTLPILTKGFSMRSAEIHYEGTSEEVYATTYEVPETQTLNSAPEIEDEDIYMVPATNEHALYSQLSQIKINHFTRDSIKLTKLLGAGQFGKVHQGEWKAATSENKIEVAVKILKEGAGEQDKVKFLQEAAIMGQFSHPNIVKLYGVVTEREPIMLIIELLPKGDLRELLCSVHSQSDYEFEIDADLPHTLLSYCRQVASGMNYLSNKSFVHRDLAARNILVSEDDVCKIADFGMSRDLDDTNFYISHGGIIPVKWTAPEALHYKKYSTASDVWSFGCVMYEIWSLGHKPFEDSTNLKCVQLMINKGLRLAPPPGCPRKIYQLMMNCWHPDPSSRPDFVSVVQQLSLPDTKLLKWSEKDKATDPEAATLGAGLDKAVGLYKDLQQSYFVTTY